MNGMEMMLNNLLKAAGFDPAVIQKNVETFANGLKNGLETAHKMLTEIQQEQRIINARLERIERALEIDPSSEHNGVATRDLTARD